MPYDLSTAPDPHCIYVKERCHSREGKTMNSCEKLTSITLVGIFAVFLDAGCAINADGAASNTDNATRLEATERQTIAAVEQSDGGTPDFHERLKACFSRCDARFGAEHLREKYNRCIQSCNEQVM